MTNWIDSHPDQAAISRHLDRLRETRPEHIAEYGGDERFAFWALLVDRTVSRITGLSLSDLADSSLRDAYDAGTSPKTAARDAIDGDDIASQILAEIIGARA